MTIKEDTRYFNERAKHKVKCKCGHSISMANRINKKLCSWCGNYVYKNEKDKFKDMLLKKINV